MLWSKRGSHCTFDSLYDFSVQKLKSWKQCESLVVSLKTRKRNHTVHLFSKMDDFFSNLNLSDSEEEQPKSSRHNVATYYTPMLTGDSWFVNHSVAELYARGKLGANYAINLIEYYYMRRNYGKALACCVQYESLTHVNAKEFSEIKARCIAKLSDHVSEHLDIKQVLCYMNQSNADFYGSAFLQMKLNAKLSNWQGSSFANNHRGCHNYDQVSGL